MATVPGKRLPISQHEAVGIQRHDHPGDRFLVQVVPASSTHRLDLILAGPDSLEIARSSALGLGWDGKVAAQTAGPYRLEVRDRSGRTGAYYLTLIGLNRPNPADDGRLRLPAGMTHHTEIGPGDFDVFDFEAAAGDRLVVRAVRTTDGEAWFAIYKPEGSPLRPNPDAKDFVSAWAHDAEGSEAILLKERGTYRIVHGTGSLIPHRSRLTILKHPWPNQPDLDGGELEPFATKTGTLEPGDTDAFFFSASTGDLVTLRLTRTAGGFQPEMWILDPSGRGIANPRGNPQAQTEALLIRSTGLHLVMVYDDTRFNPLAVESGDYSLQLSGSIQPSDPTQIYLRHLGDEHLLFWLLRRPDDILETAGPADPQAWSRLPVSISSEGGFHWARVPHLPDSRFFRVKGP